MLYGPKAWAVSNAAPEKGDFSGKAETNCLVFFKIAVIVIRKR